MTTKEFNSLTPAGKAAYWAQECAQGNKIPVIDGVAPSKEDENIPTFKLMCVDKREANKHLEQSEQNIRTYLANGSFRNHKMVEVYLKFRYNGNG